MLCSQLGHSEDVVCMPTVLNKKVSYRLGTARRESLPKIAEMDVEMTTYAEMTFKCTSGSEGHQKWHQSKTSV